MSRCKLRSLAHDDSTMTAIWLKLGFVDLPVPMAFDIERLNVHILLQWRFQSWDLNVWSWHTVRGGKFFVWENQLLMLYTHCQVATRLLLENLSLLWVVPRWSWRDLSLWLYLRVYAKIPFIHLTELTKFRAHTAAIVWRSAAFLISGTETHFTRAAHSLFIMLGTFGNLRVESTSLIGLLRLADSSTFTAWDQSSELGLTLPMAQ